MPGSKGESVFYIVESDKSFYEATVDLEAVVPRLGFVILGSHDLGAVLRGKGIEVDDESKVYAVANYRQLEKGLAADMRLGMLFPWHISVFTVDGATKIGILRPEPLLATLAPGDPVARLAHELGEKLIQIVDETR